jgi:hypothetical protein
LTQLGSASGGPLELLIERLGEMESRFIKLEKTRYWEKIPLLKVRLEQHARESDGSGASDRARAHCRPP